MTCTRINHAIVCTTPDFKPGDLQMATAALSGAYQMAEAKNQALGDYANQCVRDFEAIGEAVADYMPDADSGQLIDGIRAMDMLINAQFAFINTLRAELATYVNGKNEVAAGKKPTGYIVRTWGKDEPITKRFTKEKNAGQAATKLVRDGTTRAAFVFALVHAGTAEHKAAYVEAK